MEHIIVSNLMKHLEIQNILFPLQHGFRPNSFMRIEASFSLPGPSQ